MTLNGTNIRIDYRSEIELMQMMIENYIEHGKTDEHTKAMLGVLLGQLDVLWLSW